MQPDFSAVALLGIINHRDANDAAQEPILDSSALNYIAGALVYIELARIGRLQPTGSGQDEFKLLPSSGETDHVTGEFVSSIPEVSNIMDDGSRVGSHAIELYSESIEAGRRSPDGRWELTNGFAKVARGEGTGSYAANALATLLAQGEMGRMVSGLLGDTDQDSIKQIPIHESFWSGSVESVRLGYISEIIGAANTTLSNLG